MVKTHRKSTARFVISFASILAPTVGLANTFLVEKENIKAYFGGYAVLDMISDTTQGIDETEGTSPVARPRTVAGDTGRLVFSSRNSRLSFGVITTRQTTKIKGHIEADFLGYEPAVGAGITEAAYYQNPTLRLRHAYLQVENDSMSILAGQYWSLFGWQADFIPPTVALPPMTGTLFARTPQLTGIKTFGNMERVALSAAVSASRPTQRDSQIPNLDAGLKLTFGGRAAPYVLANGDFKVSPMQLALSGTLRHLAKPELNDKNYVTKRKNVRAYALDVLIPILASASENSRGNSLVFAGELTQGQGYGDQFPGWTGNLANPSGTGGETFTNAQPYVDPGVEGLSLKDSTLTPIKLLTWNANLQYHLPKSLHAWATVGVGELASKNAKDLRSNGGLRVYDRQREAYLNVLHDFTPEIRGGLEYSVTQTRYVDAVQAQNNRVQVSTWYRF